jgi:hypothetical protein
MEPLPSFFIIPALKTKAIAIPEAKDNLVSFNSLVRNLIEIDNIPHDSDDIQIQTFPCSSSGNLPAALGSHLHAFLEKGKEKEINFSKHDFGRQKT